MLHVVGVGTRVFVACLTCTAAAPADAACLYSDNATSNAAALRLSACPQEQVSAHAALLQTPSASHLPAELSPQALHLVAASKGSMACNLTLRHCCSPEAKEVASLEYWLADEAQTAAPPSSSTLYEPFTNELRLQY